MRFLLITAGLAVCGMTTAVEAKNLVANGSFETPGVPDGSLTRYSTGDTIGPWTVIGQSGTVDVISTDFVFDGYTLEAKKGQQWLDLTGNTETATGVEQSFKTKPGATYNLTFYSGSAYEQGGQLGTSSTVDVQIDGALLASFTFKAKKNGGTVQQWKKFSTQFVATGKSTSLAFINGDPSNDTDNGIDQVSVELADAP